MTDLNINEFVDSANKELENLICPITGSIMVNPVILTSGHTYDQNSIIKWFWKKNTDPITNKVVDTTVLIPNHSLRSSINGFIDKYINKKGNEWEKIRNICNNYKIDKKKDENEREKISKELAMKAAKQKEQQKIIENRINESNQQGRNKTELTIFICDNAPSDISYEEIKRILDLMESKKQSSYRDAMDILLYFYH